MIVKVCGLTRVVDVQAAAAAGATHLGFIAVEGTPRAVSGELLRELVAAAPEGREAVVVVRSLPCEEIAALLETSGARWVQLHGGVSADSAARLRERGYRVIAAVPVDRSGAWDDIEGVPAEEYPADFLLLDTRSTADHGAAGVPFEWADTRRPSRPFLIAGGLAPETLPAALQALHPWGIDLSSGVERTPGEKSVTRLQALGRVLHEIEATGLLAAVDPSTPPPKRGGHLRSVSAHGFGGTWVPETLVAPLIALEEAFEEAAGSESFRRELDSLLRTWVGRPTPLSRARRLEERWGATGRIWLKREDLAHTGAHKINNSLGQALLAARMGKRRVLAETGAGQHGVATAAACARLGLACVVYMGEVDMGRQALNVYRMRLLGAEVRCVRSGSRTLKDAINEALRDWVSDPEGSYYLLGSALGPQPYPSMVRWFQRVIGREAREQWLRENVALPEAVVACVGGGSNAIGIWSAFLHDLGVRLYGAEAGGSGVETGRHAARFSGGAPGVLHGTRTYVLQDADGQVRETHSISAGLDYPAVGPDHAELHSSERATYLPVSDAEALAAFHELALLEGIFPALESAHAVALARRLVMDGSVGAGGVLINLSGRGDKDVHTVAAAEGESP